MHRRAGDSGACVTFNTLELNPAPIDAKIIFEVDDNNMHSGKALSYLSTECFSSGRAQNFEEIEEEGDHQPYDDCS